VLAALCRQKVTVQALTPVDPSRLWAKLNTDNRHRLMVGIDPDA